MDFNRRILPFYMTYPGMEGREGNPLKDLEYFGQMYPERVKRYQGRVMEMLDRMDYEGSMIYDEYPDRFSLERLSMSMVDILRKEANENMEPIPEDEHFEALIYVLLCNEVYKRRHGKRKSYWIF